MIVSIVAKACRRGRSGHRPTARATIARATGTRQRRGGMWAPLCEGRSVILFALPNVRWKLCLHDGVVSPKLGLELPQQFAHHVGSPLGFLPTSVRLEGGGQLEQLHKEVIDRIALVIERTPLGPWIVRIEELRT